MKKLFILILILLILGFLIPSVSFGAIAIDAFTGSNEATATSLTFSHTATTTANRILFVGTSGDVTNDTITGVTYAGTAMTLIDKNVVSGGRMIYLWMLVNPASGANNVVVTSNASVLIRAKSASYTGAKQTGQPDAQVKRVDDTNQTAHTISVTTIADNSWMFMVGQNKGSSAVVAGTNATQRDGTAQDYGIFDTNADQTPAGSKSMQFTWTTAQPSVGIMASFAPVAEVAATAPTMQIIWWD